MSIERWQLFALHYTLKIDGITSQMTSLLSYIKPASGHLLRCQNPHLYTPGSGRGSGTGGQRKNSSIFSEILYTHYLHVEKLVPTFIGQPGAYCIPGES